MWQSLQKSLEQKSAEIARKFWSQNANKGEHVKVEVFTAQLQQELATIAETSKEKLQFEVVPPVALALQVVAPGAPENPKTNPVDEAKLQLAIVKKEHATKTVGTAAILLSGPIDR